MSNPKVKSAALFQVQWLAKIALWVALVAAASLLVAIFWVTDDQGATYGSVIVGRSLTQQKLAPVMVLFGLLVVCVAAATTWLIALYSSHRIAGPMFRFAENVKAIHHDAFATPLAIRQTDMLQRQWQEFDAAQRHLREHYGALRDALVTCQQSVSAPGTAGDWAAALAKLQEVERRVHL